MRQTNPNPLLRNPRALTIFVIIVFLLVALCLGAFLIAQGVPNRNLGQLFAAATPTKAVIAPTNTPQVFITVVVIEPPTAVSTPAPAITIAPTKTLTPTLVIARTATHTPTVKPTVVTATAAITSSATITTSVTPTTTAAVTATTTVARTPTRPPAPAGSIAYRFNDSGTNRVRVYNFDGNRSTPLLNIGPNMDEAFGTNAPIGGWSPDNSKFAFITSGTTGAANVLHVYDLQSSTSRSIYSSDTNGGGLSSPVWSADGTKIAVIKMSANQRYWTINLINADGTRCSAAYECEIASNPQGEQFRGGLSWSKQGLFALAINSSGASDVYTMFGDGSVRTQLTNDPADDTTPALSPDGKSIAFTSNRDGVSQIYWVNTDGSGLRKLSQGNHSDVSPFWSPDGNWIAFASTRNGATDIYMMDRNGGNVTRLTTTGGDRPSWTR